MQTAIAETPFVLSSTSDSSSIVVTDAASPDEWNGFVSGHAETTGYHCWQWRQVFERGLGQRCHYLAARRDGRIAGVLPLVEIRSWLFGRALSSLPYVNYGGVLADSDDVALSLLSSARQLAARRRVDFVVLRHRRQTFPELTPQTHKVTMLLPLAPDAEAMWLALDRKVRNQVRKAEKSGLVTVSGGVELLDEFYTVFSRNMRDLGTPVYGRELFAAMLAAFPDDARIHLVQLAGATIAAGLSYGYGEVVEVPSASSLREHRNLCPNHLMYWSIIQEAIRAGRRTFDFGRSTPDDGTYNFKEQWGAVPHQLWWEYALSPGAELPSTRHSPSFQRRIDLWKKLPVGIASVLGPRIARMVP
jgi:FemAB-related protein (PEP-CTERM system-associated)